MFTGIIEATGTVKQVLQQGSNVEFTLECPFTHELKPDQSVAHNGVCLTVTAIEGTAYRVTAVDETLAKTNLGAWQPGDEINLERCLRVGDRLDGHFVQGHADTIGVCTHKEVLEGSWLFKFSFPKQFAALVVEKGSVSLNGVSLTVFNVTNNSFTVTIIPYTYGHTNFHLLEVDDTVNIEFDIFGKYLLRREAVK